MIKILILLVLLVACAVPQPHYPPPDMPIVSSAPGRECLMRCQENYSNCIGASVPYYQRPNLYKTCNSTLADCYNLCE